MRRRGAVVEVERFADRAIDRVKFYRVYAPIKEWNGRQPSDLHKRVATACPNVVVPPATDVYEGESWRKKERIN